MVKLNFKTLALLSLNMITPSLSAMDAFRSPEIEDSGSESISPMDVVTSSVVEMGGSGSDDTAQEQFFTIDGENIVFQQDSYETFLKKIFEYNPYESTLDTHPLNRVMSYPLDKVIIESNAPRSSKAEKKYANQFVTGKGIRIMQDTFAKFLSQDPRLLLLQMDLVYRGIENGWYKADLLLLFQNNDLEGNLYDTVLKDFGQGKVNTSKVIQIVNALMCSRQEGSAREIHVDHLDFFYKAVFTSLDSGSITHDHVEELLFSKGINTVQPVKGVDSAFERQTSIMDSHTATFLKKILEIQQTQTDAKSAARVFKRAFESSAADPSKLLNVSPDDHLSLTFILAEMLVGEPTDSDISRILSINRSIGTGFLGLAQERCEGNEGITQETIQKISTMK